MLQFINYPFEVASKSTGASPDELKLIFSMLLSYPLAGVLKRIPDRSPMMKNIFMISVSVFYLVGLFDLWGGVQTLFISSAGAYLIASYINGPLMPWVGFVFLMGHLSVSHLERQFRPKPGKVDVSGAQMVLVMKLTAFCWNVYDGKLPDSELSDFQKARAIKELPPLLDYIAYVLYFPSLFAGPSFDYNEYRGWIDCSMFDTDVLDKKGVLKKKRKIPRSGRPSAKKALSGVLWLAAFIKFGTWYNIDFVLGDGFLEYNFLRRVWYMIWLSFTARMKYYGVWLLCEGACILTGLGYNGLDEQKRLRWDRLENVDPIALEFGQNSRAFFETWNKNTNKWLRNYVYLRVTPKGKKPGFRSSTTTFMTSAFWHGFYPGMTYRDSGVYNCIIRSDSGKVYVRPFFLTPDGTKPTKYKIYYDIFSCVTTHIAFAFMILPFIKLEFWASIAGWARLYFYNYIAFAVIFAVFKSPIRGILASKIKKRSQVEKVKESPAVEDFRAKGEPFGLPDEEIIKQDMDEALQELREIRERRKASLGNGPSPKKGSVGT